MKVRSYTGRTMDEALAKVREHLGEDALIIESRAIRDSGLIARRVGFEVVAAANETGRLQRRKRRPVASSARYCDICAGRRDVCLQLA